MPWTRKTELHPLAGERVPAAIFKARRRAVRMDSTELMAYVDNSRSEVVRCLKSHRQMPGPGDHLREAALQAATLYALLEEVSTRQVIPAPEPTPDARTGVAGALRG